MKIKEGFILREVAGNYIVVAVGDAVKGFNGVINLNETGAFLWRILEKGSDEKGMLDALLAEYDVSEEIAAKDVKTFIDKLTEAGLVK
ncbi:MAG: PqqD family protein [Clostridia bacterium]|nr:PqqD family protein [Clostridia bacterium]